MRRGREAFLASMRKLPDCRSVYSGNQIAYERTAEAGIRGAAWAGRRPSYLDVKSVMQDDPYYRAFSLLNRATQELLWDTVGESVERQLPASAQASGEPACRRRAASLTPGPGVGELPDYFTKVDIHVMPGSFHKELTAAGRRVCRRGL